MGANVGDYAHEVNEVFGEKALLHCFEPSKATFEELTRRTSAIEGVVLNRLGVGSATTTATLYTDGDGSTLASMYPRDLERFDRSMDQTETIELVSVDDYCRAHSIDHIDLLKLDIEGNELEALRGATQMIEEGRIDYIQLEFGATTLAARVTTLAQVRIVSHLEARPVPDSSLRRGVRSVYVSESCSHSPQIIGR